MHRRRGSCHCLRQPPRTRPRAIVRLENAYVYSCAVIRPNLQHAEAKRRRTVNPSPRTALKYRAFVSLSSYRAPYILSPCLHILLPPCCFLSPSALTGRHLSKYWKDE
ncbi:hypothetical protein OH77DRAFT_177608 [Trametes cingulata]|nr:hypothetical protein OH77DRAFT_177608 [Trametes cingulata]